MFGITDYSKAIVDWANFDASQVIDALVFGGAILLIGMLTVFAVLCLLWLCLAVFKLCFHDLPEKRSGKAPVKEAAAPVEQTTAHAATDAEIVAVIAAAVAMAESESCGAKFKVVSFKRI